MLDASREIRSARAWHALIGLSIGDAYGSLYFGSGSQPGDYQNHPAPPPPWPWTDDTEMACSVVASLFTYDGIDQDALAIDFAERCEPFRGYGPGAVQLLHRIRDGGDWRKLAAAAYDGQGSCGNGAAVRVPPIGAYFADLPARAATEAARSAVVTHTHPEAVAGAIAVAVATAHAVRGTKDLLGAVAAALPPGEVRAGVLRALRLGTGVSVAEAVAALGNGSRFTCQDTVPFCLWVATRHADDFVAALAACMCAGGDMDTTGALVGGIVGAALETHDVPPEWLEAREPLPTWIGPPTTAVAQA
jgi:ADP-ribosylglycohydrolase